MGGRETEEKMSFRVPPSKRPKLKYPHGPPAQRGRYLVPQQIPPSTEQTKAVSRATVGNRAERIQRSSMYASDPCEPVLEVTSFSGNVSLNLPESLRGKGFYAESANRVYIGQHFFLLDLAGTTMVITSAMYPLLFVALLQRHAKAMALAQAHHERAQHCVGGIWKRQHDGPIFLGGAVAVADASVVAEVEDQATAARIASRSESVPPMRRRRRRLRRLVGGFGSRVVGSLAAGCLAVKCVLRA